MKTVQKASRGRPDFLLLIMTLLLLGFGLVMVFSASSSIAIASSRYGGDALYFTKRQLLWAVLGSGVLLVLMNISYTKFKRGFILYFLPVFVLLALVPFIGDEVNGARSWLGIGSLGIQPTEFAKLAIILYLGSLIAKKGEKFRDFKKGLFPVMVIVGVICGMIMLQPDLGSSLVLASCAVIMIIAGGSNLKQVFLSGFIVVAIVSVVVSLSMAADPTVWQYRIERFTSYMDPWQDQQGSGFQLIRSLEALGHGGFTGAGFGQSVQKLHYLPFAYNDFIFAVIAEEFGFIGSLLFLLFYLCFIWRGLIVAIRCPDVYGTVVGVGIMGLIAVQTIINIGGVTGAIPITGVTLPLISYGGSSMLVTMACIGVLLSISREYNRPDRAERSERTTNRFRRQ
jgi:cell division protein FtsW